MQKFLQTIIVHQKYFTNYYFVEYALNELLLSIKKKKSKLLLQVVKLYK